MPTTVIIIYLDYIAILLPAEAILTKYKLRQTCTPNSWVHLFTHSLNHTMPML